MRGLRTDRTAHLVLSRHGFIQNIRLGQTNSGLEVPPTLRVAAAFTEIARAI